MILYKKFVKQCFLWYIFHMRKVSGFVLVIIVGVACILFVSQVYAGKLYIKPELELKRAKRLLNEANSDFRNGKLHISFSPEISFTEFELARKKYKQAIEIIEKFGAGHYTPGDVSDFTNRMNECTHWTKKSQQAIDNQ